jgi:hypothetical protein
MICRSNYHLKQDGPAVKTSSVDCWELTDNLRNDQHSSTNDGNINIDRIAVNDVKYWGVSKVGIPNSNLLALPALN